MYVQLFVHSSTLDYVEAAGMLRDMVVGYQLLLDYSLPRLLMLGCCGDGDTGCSLNRFHWHGLRSRGPAQIARLRLSRCQDPEQDRCDGPSSIQDLKIVGHCEKVIKLKVTFKTKNMVTSGEFSLPWKHPDQNYKEVWQCRFYLIVVGKQQSAYRTGLAMSYLFDARCFSVVTGAGKS